MLRTLMILLVLQGSLMATELFAQEQWEESGEIESAEVVIEKDREIELPFQSRNFEKIPPVPVETGGIRQEYAFPPLTLTIPFSTVDIKALKLQDEPAEEYFNNLVRLGYGNYNSPLAELYLYNRENKDYLLGLQARHLSFGKGPVDGKNSGSGETGVKAEASYFGKSATVSGHAQYGLSRWNFYGYDPALAVTEGEDSIKRTFNRYGAGLMVDNASSGSDISAKGTLSFNGQSDNLEVSENWLSFHTSVGMPLQSNLKGTLSAFADIVGYTDSLSQSRQRFGLSPSVDYSGENYTVTAGLRYVYQSDTALAASQVYPLLKASYRVADPFVAFAEISGDNQLNTWQSQTRRNPYLATQVDIHNSNKALYAEIGAKGDLSFLSYRAGYSRSVFKEYGVFFNSAADPARFILLYDTGNFKISEFFIATDIYATASLDIGLNASVYSYTSDTFEEAWHLPAYRVGLTINYLAFNKIRARAGMTYLGGIVGYDTQIGQSKELTPAVDLFIDLDYLLSDRAGVFLQFHNVAGQSYELLSNYPVRGLTAKAGFSYSF